MAAMSINRNSKTLNKNRNLTWDKNDHGCQVMAIAHTGELKIAV
jgi:hypothetical protein